MKFVRKTADYTKWDHKRSKTNLDILKVKQMIYYVTNYDKHWNTWTEWI